MKTIALLVLLSSCICGYAQELGRPLPPWKQGMLDLHHINTGRGDEAFYILPDGTTFPTEVDFNSFKRYDYVTRTSLGEMTGEIYIREVLGWMEEMKPVQSK